MMQKRIELELPVPPSVNNLYYNNRRKFSKSGRKLPGRLKTAAYRKWLDEADGWYLLQKRTITPVRGPCSILIMVPKSRADRTNLIKALEDFLVSREITGDDRHNHTVTISTTPDIDRCKIIILPLDNSKGLTP